MAKMNSADALVRHLEPMELSEALSLIPVDNKQFAEEALVLCCAYLAVGRMPREVANWLSSYLLHQRKSIKRTTRSRNMGNFAAYLSQTVPNQSIKRARLRFYRKTGISDETLQSWLANPRFRAVWTLRNKIVEIAMAAGAGKRAL